MCFSHKINDNVKMLCALNCLLKILSHHWMATAHARSITREKDGSRKDIVVGSHILYLIYYIFGTLVCFVPMPFMTCVCLWSDIWVRVAWFAYDRRDLAMDIHHVRLCGGYWMMAVVGVENPLIGARWNWCWL